MSLLLVSLVSIVLFPWVIGWLYGRQDVSYERYNWIPEVWND